MAEKLPFEKIFPYFSYRWRYDDGQYSPYAPFSRTAFVSKEPDVEDFFKKGHNTSVANNLEVINIKGVPGGGPDVVAIDILYRESISSTVYILKTIDKPLLPGKTYRSENFTVDVQIDKRSFEGALPDNQLSRPFDNVPRKAKAQEITANRLMYGNYVQKYKLPNELNPESNWEFKLQVGTYQTAEPKNGPSVKTNRLYNVGVVYLDKYGRHSGLLTQAGKDGVYGSAFNTDFSYKDRINLTAKIISAAPPWATHFKYYIKDTSNEHFNLTAFNVYNDGEGLNKSDNVYLQFNSSDRNKITEETILIPRRHNYDGEENIFTGVSRHPVLEIENEAPDIVRAQVTERSFAHLTQFLETNAQHRPSSVVNGQNDSTSDNFPKTTLGQTTMVIEDERADGWISIINAFNTYIAQQDPDETLRFEQKRNDGGSTSQSLDVSGYADRLALKIVANRTQDEARYQTGYVLIDNIELMRINGDQHRNAFKFTLSNRVDEDGNVLTDTGLDKGGSYNGINMHSDGVSTDIKIAKLALSEEGFDKIKGSFFVKVPREVTNNTDIDALPTGQLSYDDEGRVSVSTLKELNFETEPINESNLDLYWESNTLLPISEHGKTNIIRWANCIATKNVTADKVYLESRKIFDKFNSVELAKGTRVLTPDTRYSEEHRKSGIIFSGLYNSKTGINELNQFVEADGITKELEPNYGGIQRLYALDTNLIAFTEDKIFRVLADKDALFNADDSGFGGPAVNVTATNRVLGQAIAFGGNYGISTHPESLVFFNNQFYFTDAKRGTVMQLTPANGQLFPISSRGMTNFFRDRLHTADKLIGAYDGHKKMYVLSLQGYDQTDASIGSESIPGETSNITVGYSFSTESWPSRYSFVPEAGITLFNKFYTFKDGKAYLHHDSSVNRNTFYGTFADSEVEIIFNDNPSAVKEFLTLSYEGDSGWTVSKIDTESDDAALTSTWPFVKKENKYFAPIVSREAYYGGTDQGLGSATADDGSTVYKQGERDKSGIKGFYNRVRFENDATTKAELFSINTENFISQT